MESRLNLNFCSFCSYFQVLGSQAAVGVTLAFLQLLRYRNIRDTGQQDGSVCELL